MSMESKMTDNGTYYFGVTDVYPTQMYCSTVLQQNHSRNKV